MWQIYGHICTECEYSVYPPFSCNFLVGEFCGNRLISKTAHRIKLYVENFGRKSGKIWEFLFYYYYYCFFAVSDLQAAARKFLIIPNNRGVKNIFCIKYKAIQGFFLG